MTRCFLFALPFCLIASAAQAQIDTLVPPDAMQQHIRKATWRSVALPGWGQITNKKYWKAPVVWAGIGTCGYFIQDNLSNLRFYRSALIAESDDDPSTVNDTAFNGAQLESLVDTYTRWRDLSYVALAAVYLLNIVDAHVDAHLFFFDVNDDLSFHWRPSVTTGVPAAGISLGLSFR